MNKFRKFKINETLLAGLVILVVIIGVILFYSISKDKTQPSLSSESANSGRYNTWNAETASSVYFESYEAMEEYFRDPDASKGYDIFLIFLKKNF